MILAVVPVFAGIALIESENLMYLPILSKSCFTSYPSYARVCLPTDQCDITPKWDLCTRSDCEGVESIKAISIPRINSNGVLLLSLRSGQMTSFEFSLHSLNTNPIPIMIECILTKA